MTTGADYRITHTTIDRLVTKLVYASRGESRKAKHARSLLRLVGVDVPGEVEIDEGLVLPHSTTGLVLHPGTRIGRNVTLWHNVTVGRADVWLPPEPDTRVFIGDDAIIGAGAVILVRVGQRITIGAGAVVGANAVVTGDIPAGQVWAGNPARQVGQRELLHAA